ncbi:MAG: hypothetical protein NTV80_24625 [Verrucomicrobia bacterium]|nr:hypothetical protein [Verrucomicrobiota bacterium]
MLAALGMLTSGHAEITTRTDAVGKLLNEWDKAGTAAGLGAISYENRDGQHSPLNPTLYPQLRLFALNAQTGPNIGPSSMLRPQPMIGNCSMAAPANGGGSLPRLYQMSPQGTTLLMMQYLANNLMLYPEHQDHDIGANGVNGYGDLFPINNCCAVISQGSSGSDQPFLQAFLATLAAFPPETQKTLIQQRVLMPTLQAIFRQSNQMVVKDLDYFSGVAHPVVFDSTKLDELKMIQRAHDMTPDKIPPLVQISVAEETTLIAGKDYFEPAGALTHKLADTPVSIARIMRGTVDEYGMVIHLGKIADLQKRPLKLLFQVLQGDPNLVKIEHSGGAPYLRLRVRWHPPMITATGIRSNRVDIGIFAANGATVSAPAIISFYMLPNERRFYDQSGHLTEITYQAHNPDLGLPASTKDQRWLRAMLNVSIAGDGLRSRLMEKLLAVEERKAIQAVWMPLNERQQVILGLEAKPDKKDSAAKLKVDLENDIAASLDLKLPGNRGLTVRSAIARSLDTLSTFTDLYTTFQSDLLKLAATSPKKAATEDIRREVKRLVDPGILIQQAGGFISTVSAPEKLTAAERYYLQGLHLTLLSQVIFPEALDRSPAPAWVDPRLTATKPWRDVFRLNPTTGQRLGWVRHLTGRTHLFNAEGLLVPEAPKKARAVTYQVNAQGVLEWK